MFMFIVFEYFSNSNYHILIDVDPTVLHLPFYASVKPTFNFYFITHYSTLLDYLSPILSQWLVHCLWVLGVSLSTTLFVLRLK